MTNRPNERTRERDLRNIAKTLRGAAGAGPEARHPDALRDYARRIDEWADAHVGLVPLEPEPRRGVGGKLKRVMRGGIQFLAGCLVGFVFMALGWGWGALLGVLVVVVLFAKLGSETPDVGNGVR